MNNFIHQIHYSPETRAMLDPGFIALENAGQHPDWHEYWPIRRFLLENTFDPNARYGFLSPEFRHKTGLHAEQVQRFLADTPDDVDVVTFSPNFSHSALFKNMFDQAEYLNPGMATIFAATLDAIAPGIDGKTFLDELVMSSAETVYCNFFVAKPRFWERWFAVCEMIFEAAEANDSEFGRLLNAPVQLSPLVRAHVLVIERIASLILTTESADWKVRPYDSISMPDRAALSEYHGELIELDALKLAAIHTGNRTYYRKFFELQPALLSRIGVHALSDNASTTR